MQSDSWQTAQGGMHTAGICARAGGETEGPACPFPVRAARVPSAALARRRPGDASVPGPLQYTSAIETGQACAPLLCMTMRVRERSRGEAEGLR